MDKPHVPKEIPPYDSDEVVEFYIGKEFSGEFSEVMDMHEDIPTVCRISPVASHSLTMFIQKNKKSMGHSSHPGQQKIPS